MVNTAEAWTKVKALRRLTVERGATVHEAETAQRLADVIAKKYGLEGMHVATAWRPYWEERYARAEATAARTWSWEYRRCGKPRCHCMKGDGLHGPYRYKKQREGKTVRSVYLGR